VRQAPASEDRGHGTQKRGIYGVESHYKTEDLVHVVVKCKESELVIVTSSVRVQQIQIWKINK
jgi:hypothetical protein